MPHPGIFESGDLTSVIGIPPSFLNRLVERKLHGIKPSVRGDMTPGSRRWFSKEDVFGVALVYWLFQAGLRAGSGKVRTSVIQNVLDEIVKKQNASANEAAKRLTEPAWVPMLVILQQLYTVDDKGVNKKLQIRFLEQPEFDPDDALDLDPYDVELRIPVGHLFDRLESMISILTGMGTTASQSDASQGADERKNDGDL